MKFLDINGPLMHFLGKMADLMWLNILTMICCIPIFTIGASFTALHYMALKIVRDEECYITKGYFKSFLENFRQSTLIWLLMILVAVILGGDLYIILKMDMEINRVIQVVIMAIGVMVLMTAVMVFPMQAKFANPIIRTLKNSFVVAILQFPKTFLMLILLTFPVVICILSWRLVPIAFLFGFSLPALLSAMLYNKSFLKMEQQFIDANTPETESEQEDEDRIFSDKLEESVLADDQQG
ncbi:MAG: DUF624 domain-containing protein [Candidatus Gastranaerophilales bacterium]|nr:DUF624 domain-containing protein [Candidatus Gastranaerophilales bacterium]